MEQQTKTKPVVNKVNDTITTQLGKRVTHNCNSLQQEELQDTGSLFDVTMDRKKVNKNKYYLMHRGIATTLVIQCINNVVKQDMVLGIGSVENKGNKLRFENYAGNRSEKRAISLTAKQLFTALCIKATVNSKGNNIITLSLDEYMEMRGIKNKKTMRQQVKGDLNILYDISIIFKEHEKGKKEETYDFRLCTGKNNMENGIIFFEFHPTFFEYLKSKRVSPLPKGILKLNQNNNPNSFYFLEKISSHKAMNYFFTNANTLSVRVLLGSTPFIPKYEDIKGKGRINQRIIEPFERDMNALSKTLTWKYCGKNGIPINYPTTYAEFINSLIKITWFNYPERRNKPLKNIGSKK